MGGCVGRNKNKVSSSQTASPTEETAGKARSRQRLSVLQVTTPADGAPVSQEQFMEMFNLRNTGKFQRKGSARDGKKQALDTEPGKEEQGTLLLTHTKVLFEGSLSHQRQNEFEDKKMTITGESIPDRFLDNYGLAVICKKGLKPESPNQDDFCLLIDGENVIMGVFDGHGPYGHNVSDYVHALLPKLISKHDGFNSNVLTAIKDSFRKAQESLVTHCEHPSTRFDCIISGCTASVIVIKPNELHIGFVGDSRAILSRKVGETRTAVVLMPDHKPTNPDERERIERSNGEVKKLPMDIPFRVFFKGKDYPGLSMSRALGDLMAQEIGVTWEPETRSMNVQPNDEFVLVCSDGVWEFIDNEEAITLVSNYGKAKVKQAAEHLAKLAWTRWIQNEGETVDDITVMIAYLPISRIAA